MVRNTRLIEPQAVANHTTTLDDVQQEAGVLWRDGQGGGPCPIWWTHWSRQLEGEFKLVRLFPLQRNGAAPNHP